MDSPLLRRRSSGRWRTLLAIVLVGGLAAGCSVIEEIDKIGKDTKKTPPARTEAASDLPNVPDGSNQAKLRAYYNRRPKEVVEDPDDPIVTCRLAGSIQFMRKHDCTLRGGQVKG